MLAQGWWWGGAGSGEQDHRSFGRNQSPRGVQVGDPGAVLSSVHTQDQVSLQKAQELVVSPKGQGCCEDSCLGTRSASRE